MTHEELKALLIYDPIEGSFRNKFTGRLVGTFDHSYTRIYVLGKRYKAGRLAWFYMTGEWPPKQIDHINGIKADDSWDNLRLATQEQNTQNRAGFGSYPKGVSYDRRKLNRPWQARIQTNGVSKSLGYYATMEEAADVYRKAATIYHGEFAKY